MNKYSMVPLTMKVGAAVAICCLLSGCEFFCTCAAVLVMERGAQLQQQSQTDDTGDPSALRLWGNLFEDCASSQNTQETDVCPYTGQWDLGPRIDANGIHELYAPCIPGTVDPLAPSLVSPEASLVATSSSDGQNVVESTPISLPQASPHPRPMRPPRLHRTFDCTDPANAGRGDCAGTNRQNKPLSPPVEN